MTDLERAEHSSMCNPTSCPGCRQRARQKQRLIRRVVEHLDVTTLPSRPDLIARTPWPNSEHGQHTYDAWCAVCRAGTSTEALAALVTEVLAFAEADARREDRLRIADLFNVPAELLGTPRPAPLVVHAYEWFIDAQFDGLMVACREPITQAGLRATAVRGDVTCPACLDRIRVSVQ